MKTHLFALVLVLGFFAGAVQAEELEIPFFLPAPEGWNTETISFPLGFAPELDYKGFEELRFTPGMFKQDQDDFWAYVFVWWIPADTEISAAQLQKDLDAYYHGLNHTKNEGREGQPEIPAVHSVVNAVDTPEGEPLRFTGTIDTFDSFVTQEPISLNFRAEVIACAAQGRVAVFFELSPQPTTHAVWTDLQKIREGFRCEK